MRRKEPNTIAKEDIIERFDEIQKEIQKRPILGAEKWFLTKITLIGDLVFDIEVEDGHIVGSIIIKYCKDSKKIMIIEEQIHD